MIYLSYCPYGEFKRTEYAEILHTESRALLKKAFEYHGVRDLDFDSGIKKNKYGKPYFSNIPLFFNISHCSGLVVCGIHTSEIGIDVENIRPYSVKITKRMFTENENEFIDKASDKNEAFFRLWTLKESYIKYIGIGLSFPMKNIEFNISGENKITSSDSKTEFVQLRLKDYIISVCTPKNSHFDAKYIFPD